MTDQNHIECVFFAQFDNHAGPLIRSQIPDRFVSPEQFESISDYIITKHLLANKLIMVQAFQRTVLGYSVCIEDPKYQRNALNFNLGFVLSQAVSADLVLLAAFSEALRKIGSQLRAFEIQTGFVSVITVPQHPILPLFLQTLYTDLNALREASFSIDAIHSLRVRVLPRPPSDLFHSSSALSAIQSSTSASSTPTSTSATSVTLTPPSSSSLTTTTTSILLQHQPTSHSSSTSSLSSSASSFFSSSSSSLPSPVLSSSDANPSLLRDCHVPIFITQDTLAISRLIASEACDLAIKRALPFIDGMSHILRIHRLSGIDLDMLKQALSALAAFSVIRFVDIFAFHNIYVPAMGLREFYSASESQKQQALRFVCQSDTPLLSFKDLFSLYCAFDGSMTVKQICLKSPLLQAQATQQQPSSFHPRQLITFGLLNNLLHRLSPTVLVVGQTEDLALQNVPHEMEIVNAILESQEPIHLDLLFIKFGKKRSEDLLAKYPDKFLILFSVSSFQS